MREHTYFEKHLFQPLQLTGHINPATGLIVVIPCFNEPDILSTIQSLEKCQPPKCKVEVIVVINASEKSSEDVADQNEKSFQELTKWRAENHWFELFILQEESLPQKHAGVGLARKIGMDEAAYRFSQLGKNGVIVCLDADSKVPDNYFSEIENHYQNFPGTKATSIYFEHPIDDLGEKESQGILFYELHLRYYIQALRYCGLPCAFHCVGSSMTVSSETYLQQGGMNRRKAGEDFHFLQKIIPLGNFFEINGTTVYPSPRVSNRVPFGTGRAMLNWTESDDHTFYSYHPSVFDNLKIFCEEVPDLYQVKSKEMLLDFSKAMPESVMEFLDSNDFYKKLQEIKSNTNNLTSFMNRFFRWFNGLMVLKYVHFARDRYYPNCQVETAANELLSRAGNSPINNPRELLEFFRELDKSGKGITSF